MKRPKISRRTFIALGMGAVPGACTVNGLLVETRWIKVRAIDLASHPIVRLVHFTDVHYKGNRRYLTKVVHQINEISPDFVCFTGDLVEERRYLEEALDILRQVQRPIYGVPGNWDYWSRASFRAIARAFEQTGGAWLGDRGVTAAGGKVYIFGATGLQDSAEVSTEASRCLLLVHFPDFVQRPIEGRFDLILAGHSHGGQVRLPFLGPSILPPRVGNYDRGLYQTRLGPLYVNPGIGTYGSPIRFLCRPEITVISV